MFLPFQLPNELLLSSLYARFPCREVQIRALTTLLSPRSSSPRNLVLHGSEATGKSALMNAVLEVLSANGGNGDGDKEEGSEIVEKADSLRYAIVKSAECITGRHLLESTIGAVAQALDWNGPVSRCENLAQLAVELSKLLEEKKTGQEEGENGGSFETNKGRFVLVFDTVDKQRDAQNTLLQALARIGEVIPNLTTVFIITAPKPHFLHNPGAPHIHFPAYTKAEILKIITLDTPSIFSESKDSSTASSRVSSPSPDELQRTQKESKDVWTRFCSAVWDTLSKHSGRDIISFRDACNRLWPSFTQPLRDGLYNPKDFSRLLLAKRSMLQDEKTLVPSIVGTIAPPAPSIVSQLHAKSIVPRTTNPGIAAQLPYTSRLLLIAAYLASYTPARHDTLLFTKNSSAAARKKRGGGTALSRSKPGVSRSRKISRKLLGPQAFVLERMLAIFHAVRRDADSGRRSDRGGGTGSADVMMAMATLGSLRLVVRTSAVADALDASTKMKVNVGWEVVRRVARSVGVEVEDFLID